MNLIVRLRNIFKEIFDDDDLLISEETMYSDIDDWDSVAHVKLVLAIEEEFCIRLTTEEVTSIKSVGGFMAAIQKRTGM